MSTYKDWRDSLTRRERWHYDLTRKIHDIEERIDKRFDYPRWNNRTGDLTKMTCWLLGHDATMDHCGIPAHDLCAFCGKSMPNQAKRKTT